MLNDTQAAAIVRSNLDRYTIVQQEVELGASALSRGEAEMAITFFRSSLQKLDVRQTFYDHLLHNLLLSYKLDIEQKLENGDQTAARSTLTSALQLDILGEMAADVLFRKRFAAVFDSLGIIFSRHNIVDEGLRCSRKAISIYPSPGFRINLENALRASGQTAVLSDLATFPTAEQAGRHVFIACVPKSGSTFLKNTLVNITGYQDAFMVYTPGQFEQDLYLPIVESMAGLDTVTQQHCRASDANVQMMQAFGIRPVVLVRNIFDCVISLLDFYDGGAFANSFFRADYRSLDEETRIDLILDNLVPWYFEFVASWSLVEKQRRLDLMWMRYEDLIDGKAKAVKDVLAFYGLSAPPSGIVQRTSEVEREKRQSRFNKGIAGRGESRLSDDQKNRVRSYTRYHPTTDFARIGL